MKEFNFEHAKEVIERKLPADKIKQREGSFGKMLDYIEGSTVIDLLNEAFDYLWSFEILKIERIESEKKYVKATKEYKDEFPYILVHGRLTIPQINIVKEQYGTKIILGGASEQEGAAKSAATDALKKCATLLGIGAELYEDKEPDKDTSSTKTDYKKNDYKSDYKKTNYKKQETVRKYDQNKEPRPTVVATAEAPKTKEEFPPEEVRKLVELKAILGIDENAKLNPFAIEFVGNAKSTYLDITPDNIKAFNKFLEKKTEGI